MSPNNQFQQQQQRQQQMRRMQMGAAWMAQQKKKEEAARAAADPFARLEQYVHHLRGEYAAGRVTRDQAENELRENVITDASGTRWTVGFETMQWYRAAGGQWEKADRPHFAAGLPENVPAGRKHPVKGFFAFIFGCILTLVAGFVMGWFTYEVLETGSPADLYMASLVWAVGFLLSVRKGRKVARGG